MTESLIYVQNHVSEIWKCVYHASQEFGLPVMPHSYPRITDSRKWVNFSSTDSSKTLSLTQAFRATDIWSKNYHLFNSPVHLILFEIRRVVKLATGIVCSNPQLSFLILNKLMICWSTYTPCDNFAGIFWIGLFSNMDEQIRHFRHVKASVSVLSERFLPPLMYDLSTWRNYISSRCI